MFTIEISPKEKMFIVFSLIDYQNNLVNRIESKKKNKIKYRLLDDENDLKEVRKLINFFDKIK